MWLRITEADGESRTLEVRGDRNVIGSDPGADIAIADEGLAPRHAELKALPDGRLEIGDLGSGQPTIVGGVTIQGPATLEGGEEITLGGATIEVSRERPGADEVTSATRSSRAIILAAGALGLAVVAIVLAAAGVFSSDDEDDGGLEPSELVDQVRDGTALVVASANGVRQGNGTGWVLDADEGLVVTNAHVVDAGETFDVGDGEHLTDAEVVGVAPCDDLAVLKAEDTEGLEEIPLGSQSDLAQGDPVLAVGYPVNASPSDELQVSSGVVSVVEEPYDLPGDPYMQHYPNVIQTDAPINPGNSGGPLVDSEGNLVGVNTLIFRGQRGEIEGQGYAIGVDHARDVLELLRTGNSQAWGGFAFTPLLPREAKRLGIPQGLMITTVVPGTAAANAGLRPQNALVVAVGGDQVQTFREYCDAVGAVEDGDTVELNVLEPSGARVFTLER